MSRINYDLSKIKAVVFDVDGVLSPSTIPMDAEGMPMRMANIKDGYAMQLAAKSGILLCIISGAAVPAVRNRFNALGVKDIFLGAAEKLPVFLKWLDDNELEPEEVAFVGDDIPDLPVMKVCGLPVAPRDAAHECKAAAKFITAADGGYGVARELLEEILRVSGHWLDHGKAFGW